MPEISAKERLESLQNFLKSHFADAHGYVQGEIVDHRHDYEHPFAEMNFRLDSGGLLYEFHVRAIDMQDDFEIEVCRRRIIDIPVRKVNACHGSKTYSYEETLLFFDKIKEVSRIANHM